VRMEMAKYKYPSTLHLPCSKQVNVDDTTALQGYQNFVGQEVVITEKMDGENATLVREYYHARSLDSRHHPFRNWIKSFWASKRFDIPAEVSTLWRKSLRTP